MINSFIEKTLVISALVFLAVIALSSSARAASAAKINAKVNVAMDRFYTKVGAAKELAKKSREGYQKPIRTYSVNL